MKISPKQSLFILALIFAMSGLVAAQGGGVNRIETFAGYSHSRVDTTLDSEDFDEEFGGRVGANGVNISVTGNFTKYIGDRHPAFFKNNFRRW